MLTKEEIKKLAAAKAVQLLQKDTTIGIGTGSTVYWFIQQLAAMVKEGFNCRCVPTSLESDTMAKKLGIPMVELNDVSKINITVDGADEIDPQLNVIKGGGAALLQEKMVAAASDMLVIIADSGKLVKQLGAFALPVEVIPYGWKQVQQRIYANYNIAAGLRMKADKPLLTDHGHYILDCPFNAISDPKQLNIELNTIPGVVDNGLFVRMAHWAIIAYDDGHVTQLTPEIKTL